MCSILGSVVRRNVSKVVLVPQFEPKVLEDLKNNAYKPRHHPGKRAHQVITAPKEVEEAIKIIVTKIQAGNLIKDGEIMRKYLKSRELPAENREVVKKMHIFKGELLTKMGLDDVDIEETYHPDDIELLDRGVRRQVNKLLKQRTYNWEPVDFTEYIARVYLWNRFVPEYAVLVKVMEEIRSLLPDFRAHSLFDFGSGVGTAIWASHLYWGSHISEYYCVDPAASMLDISTLVLQGGRPNKHPGIRNVVYRQFFPASTPNKFSLVVCAYTLLELPTQKERIETIAKLWEKTEDFLIIVDHGSVSGNKVVLEARDYILRLNTKRPGSVHVLAPCPHEAPCPKINLAHHCNFAVKYENVTYSRGERRILDEKFCYVILRKGERRDTPDAESPWPRLVRPVLKRSKHTICNLCTKDGELAQMIFTNRKHGVFQHRCAKGSRWGDLLPMKVCKEEIVIDDDDDGLDNDESDDDKDDQISDDETTNVAKDQR